MRLRSTICLVLASALTPICLHLSAAASPLSLEQYVQILNDTLTRTRELPQKPETVSALRDSLPSAWRVQTEGKSFEIPTESIRRDLGVWESKRDDATLQQ